MNSQHKIKQESVQEATSTNKNQKKYRLNDPFFLVLFLLHLIVVITIAICYGSIALTHIGAGSATVSESGVLSYAPPINRIEAFKLMIGLIITILISIVLSMSWIFFLSRFAAFFVASLISSIILMTLVLASFIIFSGLTLVGILLIAFALLILITSLFFRPRIDFASVNLRVACAATLSSPAAFIASAVVQCIQGIFTMIWAVAVYGIATNNDETILYNIQTHIYYNIKQCITYKYSNFIHIDENLSLECSNGGSYSCEACVCGGSLLFEKACFNAKFYSYSYLLMLFSLLWTCGVCSSLVQCTTAVVVSQWWSKKHSEASIEEEDVEDDGECCQKSYCLDVIKESGLKRSLTLSLGSLCLGSLLVTIIRGLRAALKFLIQQSKALNGDYSSSSSSSTSSWSSASTSVAGIVYRRGCVLSILAYLLTLLDWAMTYFNRYAFCYVGVYGENFIKASKSALELFRRKGWMNVLLNDDIIDFVLDISNVVIGIFSMLTGFYLGAFLGLMGLNRNLLTMFGFLSGYFISKTTLSVISAAVSTVYICFGESPDVLKETHPELHHALQSAWSQIVPSNSLMDAAGNITTVDSDGLTQNRVIRGSYCPPSAVDDASGGNVVNRGNYSSPFIMSSTTKASNPSNSQSLQETLLTVSDDDDEDIDDNNHPRTSLTSNSSFFQQFNRSSFSSSMTGYRSVRSGEETISASQVLKGLFEAVHHYSSGGRLNNVNSYTNRRDEIEDFMSL